MCARVGARPGLTYPNNRLYCYSAYRICNSLVNILEIVELN